MTDIEKAARAAYEAGMELRKDQRMPVEPWASLLEYWRKIYRAQAGAVLDLLNAERTGV